MQMGTCGASAPCPDDSRSSQASHTLSAPRMPGRSHVPVSRPPSLGTSSSGRGRSQGFTLIEMLITAVVAGILLAALVPFFLLNVHKASASQVRNVALNLAQDRIEKIRQLDFDQLVEAEADGPNYSDTLASSTWAGGMFGSEWTSYSGTSAKVFTISYDLSTTGSSSAAQEAAVTVTVRWTGSPRPVKPVVLRTVISRQSVGPQIVALNVSPTNSSGDVNNTPVVMTATVASGADRTNTSYVKFSVVSSSGAVLLAADAGRVDNTGGSGSGLNGVYSVSSPTGWGAANGTYVFLATAYSDEDAPGNSWEVHADIALSSAPARVTNVVAAAGDHRATLSWNANTATDFDHFQVWRGTAAGGESLVLDNLMATGVTDTGLANSTRYYYTVYAVDRDGNASQASTEVSVVPATKPDTTPPTTPSTFTAVRSADGADLDWAVSTDPETAIQCYYIYRDGGTLPYARVSATSLTYTDLIGYSLQHSYSVVACNSVGLLSGPTPTVAVLPAAPPTYRLTVTDNKASPGVVVNLVQTDALPDPYDWGNKVVSSGSPGVWAGVPYGWYAVTAYWSGTPVTQTVWLNGDKTITFTF